MRGIHPRSLHCLDPFPGRPTQNTLPDGSPRKRTIAPEENHPSEAPNHPRDTLSPSCSVQRRDRDGVVVTDGGTSGAPTRFPPVRGVGGLGRESSGVGHSAPA